MCLLIEVTIPTVSRQSAGDVSNASAAMSGILRLRAQRQDKRAAGSRFLLCEGDEGCACSLLAESADWNLEHLDLDPAKAPLLANTFRYLANLAGAEGFEIRSAWLTGPWPDSRERPEALDLSQLLSLVSACRLPTALHACVSDAGRAPSPRSPGR
ncbi:MAG TPA: hypothetical protein VF756_17475 [Thermoanaerobaculia bacterium]